MSSTPHTLFFATKSLGYDPAAARICYAMVLELFTRILTSTSSSPIPISISQVPVLRFPQSPS